VRGLEKRKDWKKVGSNEQYETDLGTLYRSFVPGFQVRLG